MAKKLFPVTVVAGVDKTLAPANVAAIPAGQPFTAPVIFDETRFPLTDLGLGVGVTLYLRVAVLAPVPAQLKIAVLPLDWINHLDGGGRELFDSDFPAVGGLSLPLTSLDGARDWADVRLLQPVPAIPNLYEFQVTLKDDNDEFNQGANPNNWFLVFKCDTATRATWAVGDTPANAQIPWIHVDPAELDFNQVGMTTLPPSLPGVVTPRNVTVRNFGTGSLTLPQLPDPAPAGRDLGQGFTLDADTTIAPTGEATVALSFTAPATAGLKEVTADFTSAATLSNDELALVEAGTEHNARLTMRARVGLVDTVLLLDSSGSMGWGQDGNFSPAAGQRRWDFMRDAGVQLASGYVDFLSDQVTGSPPPAAGLLKIASFPNPAAPGTAGTLFPPSGGSAVIGPETVDGVTLVLDAVTPRGGTPMGDGLGHAAGTTDVDAGLFSTDAHNTRWLALMSDGAHNSGTLQPSQFYVEDAIGDLADKKINLMTVAYGQPGATDVDHALMSSLALNAFTGSATRALVADTDEGGNDIRKRFRDVLAQSLGLTEPDDPEGLLDGQHREALHDFVLSPFDERAAVYIDWSSFDSDRVTVELITPRCERISESYAEEHPQLKFRTGNRFKYFFISREFLSGGDGRSRYGTWTLRLTLNPVPDVIGLARGAGAAKAPRDSEHGGLYEPERYVYSVLSQSSVRLDAGVEQAEQFAGEPVDILAHLSAAGTPLRAAGLSVRVTAPGLSFDNWLALQEVAAEDFERVAKQMQQSGGVTHPFMIKARVLQLQERSFPTTPVTSVLSMQEVEPGVYRARLSDTAVPGTYDLYVVASGEAAGGARFRRETRLQISVQPRPVAERTDFGVVVDPAKQQASVRVWPRDRFGNVVLFDPQSRPRLTFHVQCGQLVGATRANLDGSYSQDLRYDPKRVPEIAVRMDGDEFLVRRLGTPEKQLWMDTVVAHRKGRVADGVKNQFDDPRAALGPVTGPDDRFLAMGSRGTVTLTSKRHAFRASDISVFVKQEGGPRPYAVEVALSSGHWRGEWKKQWRQCWVRIGVSSGLTEAFDVSRFCGRPIVAVRVRDLGSPVVGRDGKGLTAPGVLLQGVGFRPFRQSADTGKRRQADRHGGDGGRWYAPEPTAVAPLEPAVLSLSRNLP